MFIDRYGVASLVTYIKIDKYYVSCHFKCDVTGETIISTVPFVYCKEREKPKLLKILFHPLRTYREYHHSPITVFSNAPEETIILKAFKEVSDNFTWNQEESKYIHR